MNFHDDVETLPFLSDLFKSAFDFVLLTSDFADVIDGFCVSDEVFLYEDLVESEAFTLGVEIDMVFEFSPMTCTNEGFS